jgi:hypothetical protein
MEATFAQMESNGMEGRSMPELARFGPGSNAFSRVGAYRDSRRGEPAKLARGEWPADCRGEPSGLERFPIGLNQKALWIPCLIAFSAENRYPPVGSWPEGMLFRKML